MTEKQVGTRRMNCMAQHLSFATKIISHFTEVTNWRGQLSDTLTEKLDGLNEMDFDYPTAPSGLFKAAVTIRFRHGDIIGRWIGEVCRKKKLAERYACWVAYKSLEKANWVLRSVKCRIEEGVTCKMSFRLAMLNLASTLIYIYCLF